MATVYKNWERLVGATFQPEQLPGVGQDAAGLAGAAPSLGQTTRIERILQASDDTGDEDSNVARILCEQAYCLAHNLDPSQKGIGVIRFKTGIMSVIKQKRIRNNGICIDRQYDTERLWEFYLGCKRHHRVDDSLRQQQRLMESGIVTTNLEEIVEMEKVNETVRALLDVLEMLVRDANSDGVAKLIMEEEKSSLVNANSFYNVLSNQT